MPDLLFLGPPAAYETLAPAAEAAGVHLFPAHLSDAEQVLSVYGGILDGAVLCGGSAEAINRLGAIAPRLPVAVLDFSAGSSPEALCGAVQAEVVLQRVLEELRFVEEEKGTAERMEVVCELPSGTWLAHATFRLAGVTSPRSPGEAERFAKAARRWHLSVADVIGCLPEWMTLRTRYAAVGGTLHMGMLLTAEGKDAHQATHRLDEARRHLDPLLREGLVADGAYVLDGAGDEILRAPIRARVALALHAPEADELAPLFDTFHDDPWVQSDGAALAEGEADGVALPVAGPNGALGPLLQVLVSLSSPAVVDVVARPAPLSAEERSRAADLARRASALMRTTPWDGPKRLARRAVQLAIEADRALHVEVAVAVEDEVVPASLIVEASKVLVGDAASVQTVPARAEVRGGLLILEGPKGPDTLRGRLAPDEAARQLRLPSPGFSITGVPAMHPARLATPEALPADGALIGHAPDGREVRISAEALTTHALFCGATGMGKSTLAGTLAVELAEQGGGLLVMDPHGTLCRQIRDRLPASRREDLVWVDGGTDHEHRINLLDFDEDDPASRDRVFDDLYAFFDAWYDMKDSGGPMFELHLREALRLLLHDPTERHALPAIVRLFTDSTFRELLVAVCENEQTQAFWRDAERRTDHARIADVSPYVYSKINRLLGSHAVRQMVSSPETTLDPSAWLRDGAVVLVTLPVGTMGAEGVSVIGSVLLSRLVRAGFARLHGGGDPSPFVAVLDEAQRFASGHEAGGSDG